MQKRFCEESNPAEIIHDHRLRDLYERFLTRIRSVHDDVVLEATRVDVRIFFWESLLCRIVPYRDLFHCQIGEENPWEIRVRDEATCVRALDRVLDAFFERFASGGAISSGSG